ncbi:nitroreductase family protein, partial [Hydrogenophaga sp.]
MWQSYPNVVLESSGAVSPRRFFSAALRSQKGGLSVHVDEAIRSRKSVRRFLPASVPSSVVQHILSVAARAPSGNNVQPWKVYAVAGEARQRLCDAFIEAATHEPDRHQPEYAYYPTTWVE